MENQLEINMDNAMDTKVLQVSCRNISGNGREKWEFLYCWGLYRDYYKDPFFQSRSVNPTDIFSLSRWNIALGIL